MKTQTQASKVIYVEKISLSSLNRLNALGYKVIVTKGGGK